MHRRQPSPTLFPYTTLFRSAPGGGRSSTATTAGVSGRSAGGERASRLERSLTPVVAGMAAAAVDAAIARAATDANTRSEEHTSELQSRFDLVCRLLLEKKKM